MIPLVVAGLAVHKLQIVLNLRLPKAPFTNPDSGSSLSGFLVSGDGVGLSKVTILIF